MRNTRLAGKGLCFFRVKDQKKSRMTKTMDEKEEWDNDRKQKLQNIKVTFIHPLAVILNNFTK